MQGTGCTVQNYDNRSNENLTISRTTDRVFEKTTRIGYKSNRPELNGIRQNGSTPSR